MHPKSGSPNPKLLFPHCLSLSCPAGPLPVSLAPASLLSPQQTGPCPLAPLSSSDPLASPWAAFSPSAAVSWQHHSLTSSTASSPLLSPSRRLFSLLTLHGSCTLKFEPLLPSHITLTRDFALLPWLQPATTYCSLLKLNVEPQSCQFALCTPLPYFQLANIGYISLFMPALPLDPSPF